MQFVEHCPQGCHNGGICSGPNQCTCISEWKGKDCRIRKYTITTTVRHKILMRENIDKFDEFPAIHQYVFSLSKFFI